jgi:hypothetical protein
MRFDDRGKILYIYCRKDKIMKLGEALIKAGLITERQLKEALERQAVFGGRIDTNLVELRFIEDAKLALFLGKFLNLPTVGPDMVTSIPEDVINLFSREIVEKYKILPFKIDRHKLHVAMLDPKDIKVIDDLRFKTGHEIVPHVITELRLLNTFEKYYGIKKDLRYISIKDRFAPEIEIRDSDIERSESKFIQGKYIEKKSEAFSPDKMKDILHEAKVQNAQEKSDLIGALLSNAFYTAKLFYLQEGKTFTDEEVENEVIGNWLRITKRIVNFLKDTR